MAMQYTVLGSTAVRPITVHGDEVDAIPDAEHILNSEAQYAELQKQVCTAGATWQQLKTHGMIPSPRCSHSATVVGDLMWVIGGAAVDFGTENFKHCRHVYALHLISLEWRLVLDDPSFLDRRGHSAALHANTSNIVVFGGARQHLSDLALQTEQLLADLWVLHASESFSGLDTVCWSQPQACGHPPSARRGHRAAIVDGSMLVWGGLALSDPDGFIHALRLDTWRWSRVCTRGGVPRSLVFFGACVARREHTTGLDTPRCWRDKDGATIRCAENRLYVFGGVNWLADAPACNYLWEVELHFAEDASTSDADVAGAGTQRHTPPQTSPAAQPTASMVGQEGSRERSKQHSHTRSQTRSYESTKAGGQGDGARRERGATCVLSVWRAIPLSHAPCARFCPELCEGIGHLLLFGGSTQQGDALNDAWLLTLSKYVRFSQGSSRRIGGVADAHMRVAVGTEGQEEDSRAHAPVTAREERAPMSSRGQSGEESRESSMDGDVGQSLEGGRVQRGEASYNYSSEVSSEEMVQTLSTDLNGHEGAREDEVGNAGIQNDYVHDHGHGGDDGGDASQVDDVDNDHMGVGLAGNDHFGGGFGGIDDADVFEGDNPTAAAAAGGAEEDSFESAASSEEEDGAAARRAAAVASGLAPAGRNAMSAVRVGTRFLVFGGGVYPSAYFNDLWALQLRVTPVLPPPPSYVPATLLPQLQSLVGSSHNADVAIAAADGTAVPAHKRLLCSSESDYFRLLYEGSFREGIGFGASNQMGSQVERKEAAIRSLLGDQISLHAGDGASPQVASPGAPIVSHAQEASALDIDSAPQTGVQHSPLDSPQSPLQSSSQEPRRSPSEQSLGRPLRLPVDLSREALLDLLRFLYTGELHTLDARADAAVVLELAHAAVALGMPQLQRTCEAEIGACLTNEPSQLLNVLAVADELHCTSLRTFALGLMREWHGPWSADAQQWRSQLLAAPHASANSKGNQGAHCDRAGRSRSKESQAVSNRLTELPGLDRVLASPQLLADVEIALGRPLAS